jgi:predicted nucleic acid-binding Zn ribbon protein
MSIPIRRGPRTLSEILGELFAVRGYGRLHARHELEAAWNTAVGEPYCRQTRLGEVRRGVLSVTVAHSALLEELAAFRKPALLAALRSSVPATTIRDIRFRIGVIPPQVAPERTDASGEKGVAPGGLSAAARRGQEERGSKPGRGYGHDPAQA